MNNKTDSDMANECVEAFRPLKDAADRVLAAPRSIVIGWSDEYVLSLHKQLDEYRGVRDGNLLSVLDRPVVLWPGTPEFNRYWKI